MSFANPYDVNNMEKKWNINMLNVGILMFKEKLFTFAGII